ncbi:MAG: hypothetical protein Q7S40_20270 [Opitutaceae bacterium]|nr:hypothetical protein [Opitutaceae bacterium]
MKRFRIAALSIAGLLALLLIAVAVGFSSWFQTWAARRALASQPGWSGSIGSVSAGLKRVELKNVRVERDGAVLTVPAADAQLPLLAAAFREQILISRLVAKGWTIDLSKWKPGSGAVNAAQTSGAPAQRGGSAKTTSAPVGAGSAATPPPKSGNERAAFHGIFNQLRLPFDLALDGIDIAGEVILPDGRGRSTIAISGGGLAAGQEGRFKFDTGAALTDPKVTTVGLRGTVTAAMDTPRTITRVAMNADAAASGTQFPKGVTLKADLAAARGATGETYSAGVVTEGRQLLLVQADFPRQAQQLSGTWKLDVRDDDVSPFALGRPLPEFSARGEGKFDTDAAFAAAHVSGRIEGGADKLTVFLPQLNGVGAIKLSADFDVTRSGEVIAIRKLNADVAGERPVATVTALQAFEFNPASAQLKAEDPARELLGIVVHGLPLAWAQPFLGDVAVTGGDVRGELVASMRAGGTTVRTKSPVTIAGATVRQAGKMLIEGVDIALSTSADYTPHGWQAEITEFTAVAGDVTMLRVNAKAGQLAGKDQPLKATGHLKADLPTWLAQPVARGTVALTRGDAVVDFIASVDGKKALQAKIALNNLAAPAPKTAEKSAGDAGAATTPKRATLPSLSTDLRADVAANGDITIHAPIEIQRDDRKSDVTIAGTVKPAKNLSTIDAQVTSNLLVIDDAQVLVALLPPEDGKQPEKARDLTPPWAGLRGTLALQLKKVVYSESFQATNVVGTLRLEENGMKFDGVRVMLGEGDAKLNGTVSFDAASPQPYGLIADMVVTQFDPGPLFRAVDSTRPPTVEGKFNVKTQLSSRAGTLGDLAAGAGGEFELTSRGGIFRGLPVNINNIVESTGRLAGWIASAGTAFGALTGKKDYADVASKAEAVAELAKGLNPIPYDQLAIVMSRDERLNTTLKDFTLISPEIRLAGQGHAVHEPGSRLFDDPLAMEFTLRVRARGRQGELLKYLGALDTQTDDLGYAACALPVKIGGTLGKPDASEFSNRVAALAVEKSGLADKAAEFLNRIRGNGGK